MSLERERLKTSGGEHARREAALPRRERQKTERKERLYQAAAQLFRKKGYERTKIEEITELADLSRGTFFNYYASKQDILHQMAEEAVGFHEATLRRALESDRPTSELIPEILTEMGKILESGREFYRKVYLEIADSYFGLVLRRRGRDGGGIFGLMETLIARGQSRGEIAAEHDPALLSEILVGTYYHLNLVWFHSSRSYSLSARLVEAGRIFMRGVRSEGAAPGRRDS